MERCAVDASFDAWPVRKAFQGRWTILTAAVCLAGALGTVDFFLLRLGLSGWPVGKPGALLAAGVVTVLCLAALATAIQAGLERVAPTIEVRGPSIAAIPGQRLAFAWRLARTSSCIESFTITLEAYEERRKGHGSHDPWRRTMLLTRSLAPSRLDLRPDAGLFTVDIPTNAQPTADRPTFRRSWTLRLDGEVRWLPNLRQTYQLDVGGVADAHESALSSSRGGRSCRCKRRPLQIDRRRSRQTGSPPRRVRPGL